MRKIIHLDMDCFYAAIEVRDHPDLLRGKPVGVGGSSRRGVLTTCNYEARKFGCRSAMPTYKALELCPTLILVPTRFEVYRREAEKIRAIMRDVTDLVEPLSLDEAYLDVTDRPEFAWKIAKDLRARVFHETGLTASAGIAPNKLLAKIASDWKKPNGQFAILPADIGNFMRELPVQRLRGVGPKTHAKLTSLKINSCADLQNVGRERLVELFGSFGSELFDQASGIDDREVVPNRFRKSLSNERTFDESLESDYACIEVLPGLFRELDEELRAKAAKRKITKIFVRIKFDDFNKTSREAVAHHARLPDFERLLREALARRAGRSVRLMGVGVRFADDAKVGIQLEFDFTNEGVGG